MSSLPGALESSEVGRARSQRAFDRWAAFCDRPSAWALMGLWSFLEALVWPIIPDFLLALACHRPAWTRGSALAACVGGSAIGTAILYCVTLARPADVMRLLPRLPFVFGADIESVGRRIKRTVPPRLSGSR